MKHLFWILGLAAVLLSALMLFVSAPSAPKGQQDTTVQIFYPERADEVPPFSQHDIQRLIEAVRQHRQVLERVTVFAEATRQDPVTYREQMDCGLQLHTRYGCTITLPGITAPPGEMIPRLATEIDDAVKQFEEMGLAVPPGIAAPPAKSDPQTVSE